jgi:GNAT superfamily N-acetyltransferase
VAELASALTVKDEPFTSLAVRGLMAESDRQARLVYADTWDPDRESTVDPADFELPGGRFVVAYSGDQRLACGGFRALSDGVAEVKRLFVTVAARRQGIGSHLLRELERSASERGYGLVRLDTGARQPAALALFRSRGYREIADYNGNELAAHWFEKRLNCPGDLARC